MSDESIKYSPEDEMMVDSRYTVGEVDIDDIQAILFQSESDDDQWVASPIVSNAVALHVSLRSAETNRSFYQNNHLGLESDVVHIPLTATREVIQDDLEFLALYPSGLRRSFDAEMTPDDEDRKKLVVKATDTTILVDPGENFDATKPYTTTVAVFAVART